MSVPEKEFSQFDERHPALDPNRCPQLSGHSRPSERGRQSEPLRGFLESGG
jgi:hypothetical protein